MSNIQWSKMFLGDESYAGASSHYVLEEAMREIYGLSISSPPTKGVVPSI